MVAVKEPESLVLGIDSADGEALLIVLKLIKNEVVGSVWKKQKFLEAVVVPKIIGVLTR